MKTLVAAAAVIVAAAPATAMSADGALEASSCVGSKPACYATIQSALDAAPAGATIKIRAGTYAGGITIEKSVRLKGASAGATVIRGGGPVVTVGIAGAPTQPTVSISGVTITGGVNAATLARGGGVYVPASSSGLGATVTIKDTIIADNRVAPASVAPGCGSHPFALASGGGIDNAGAMTLTNVEVTANEVGSDLTSDADGGGIMNEFGATLDLRDTVVSGNRARVTAPNGRFAAGGGIFTRRGSTLAIDASVVDTNSVDYSTSVPADDPCSGFGQAGGIKIGGDETTSVTIRDSSISRNNVAASSSVGDVIAFGGGIDDDGTLTLSDSTLDANTVTGTGVGGVFLDAGALEIDGPAAIRNTRITGNSVIATAPSGTAVAQGGGILSASDELVTVTDTVVSGNVARSATATAAASVQGGGILNAGLLELGGVKISDNSGKATGLSGAAEGGGMWNGALPDGPPVQLSLRDSSVTRNDLTASPGLANRGGGLYTSFPVTLANSLIAQNTPDDCFGC